MCRLSWNAGPQPSETLRVCPGLYRGCSTLTFYIFQHSPYTQNRILAISVLFTPTKRDSEFFFSSSFLSFLLFRKTEVGSHKNSSKFRIDIYTYLSDFCFRKILNRGWWLWSFFFKLFRIYSKEGKMHPLEVNWAEEIGIDISSIYWGESKLYVAENMNNLGKYVLKG